MIIEFCFNNPICAAALIISVLTNLIQWLTAPTESFLHDYEQKKRQLADLDDLHARCRRRIRDIILSIKLYGFDLENTSHLRITNEYISEMSFEEMVLYLHVIIPHIPKGQIDDIREKINDIKKHIGCEPKSLNAAGKDSIRIGKH